MKTALLSTQPQEIALITGQTAKLKPSTASTAMSVSRSKFDDFKRSIAREWANKLGYEPTYLVKQEPALKDEPQKDSALKDTVLEGSALKDEVFEDSALNKYGFKEVLPNGETSTSRAKRHSLSKKVSASPRHDMGTNCSIESRFEGLIKQLIEAEASNIQAMAAYSKNNHPLEEKYINKRVMYKEVNLLTKAVTDLVFAFSDYYRQEDLNKQHCQNQSCSQSEKGQECNF